MSDRAKDIALIERYVGGDMDAFDQLVRAHRDRVFAVCLRMLKDREAALDATQDTFVTLFRKADRFRAEAAFTTWLYRVTMNVCYDHLRRSQRRRTEPLPESNDPADPASADRFESAEVRPDIDSALNDIPPEFRAAVVLVDLQGLSLEMAADSLGVPIGTVKSRVYRGRRLLAQRLGNLKPGTEHQREE